MEDAGAMGLVEGVGNLSADAQRLIEGKRALRPLEAGGERLALEILHHQVVDVAVAADVVHHADVRMGERGHGARLALESQPSLGIRGEILRQDLDGDRPIEPRVAGLVDLAHAAGAERRLKLIRAETSASGKGHALRPGVRPPRSTGPRRG